MTDRSGLVTWNLFVLAAGVLATLFPIYYYSSLQTSLSERAPTYTETIPDPRVVQGQLSNIQHWEDGYAVSYLFPAQDLDGSVVYHSGQMLVRDESYAALAMGDPLTIVYSGPRPRTSFIRDQVLSPPVRVYPAFALWLVLASANGLAVTLLGVRGLVRREPVPGDSPPSFYTPDPVQQKMAVWQWRFRSIRKALIAGWASALAYGQILILVGVIGLGSLSGPGFILWLILLPGWPFYFLVDADPISVRQMGMISGAAWFVIGAVIPSITQNRWKSIALWMGLALISIVLGIVLVVSNLEKIGP